MEQVRVSPKTPMLTCLLEGAAGSGKTALAATLAIGSEFPFTKLVSADTMVGQSEMGKCQALAKVFEDAYKSPLSLIVLDDIERLLEYVAIGPRFSNVVLQALLILLKRQPPEGKKLLVIGTTSLPHVFEDMGLTATFNVSLHCPLLGGEEGKKVLSQIGAFEPHELDAAVALLDEQTPIKKLFMLLEMARHGGGGGGGGDGDAEDGGKIPLERWNRVHGGSARVSQGSRRGGSRRRVCFPSNGVERARVLLCCTVVDTRERRPRPSRAQAVRK